jgi:hypothetical protein
MTLERCQRRIPLQLDRQDFGKERRQAALPEGVLGVGDKDETTAGLKHAGALRQEAGQVINAVDDCRGRPRVRQARSTTGANSS